MKYLTLIRHAKAENTHSGSTDADRVLTVRGEEDARAMGHVLEKLFPPPRLVHVSTAVRADYTIRLMLEAYRTVEPEVERSPDLYLASATEIWDFAYSALLDADEVWLCAHNPGITEAVEELSGSRIERVPAGSVVRIAFEELLPAGSNGSLAFFDLPANHHGS